jgi:hypothetical protein
MQPSIPRVTLIAGLLAVATGSPGGADPWPWFTHPHDPNYIDGERIVVYVTGDTVTLDLASDLLGGPSVTYGWSRFATAPWLVDTRGRPVPVFRFVAPD